MKTVIRNSIFETNSSVCHAIVILSENNYKKWKADDSLYVYCSQRDREGVDKDKLYTFDEVKELLIAHFKWDEHDFEPEEDDDEEEFEKELKREIGWSGFFTYDSWNDDDESPLEEDDYYYTSEHGDEIVIRTKYGYDG